MTNKLIEQMVPTHFRAVLDPAQVPQQLNHDLHVVGFRDRKSADNWVASKLDFDGWRYVIEPLYIAAEIQRVLDAHIPLMQRVSYDQGVQSFLGIDHKDAEMWREHCALADRDEFRLSMEYKDICGQTFIARKIFSGGSKVSFEVAIQAIKHLLFSVLPEGRKK